MSHPFRNAKGKSEQIFSGKVLKLKITRVNRLPEMIVYSPSTVCSISGRFMDPNHECFWKYFCVNLILLYLLIWVVTLTLYQLTEQFFFRYVFKSPFTIKGNIAHGIPLWTDIPNRDRTLGWLNFRIIITSSTKASIFWVWSSPKKSQYHFRVLL